MSSVAPIKILKQIVNLTMDQRVHLGALSILVGALGGGAAIAFREAIVLIQYFIYGFSSERFHSNVAEVDWWIILFAPCLGGLVVAVLIHFFLPEQRPRGVADVMEASALRRGQMNIKAGLAAFGVSAITIGSGGSSGREGPVVHFAAMLSSVVVRVLQIDPSLRRTLLGCGVAAGVAASFNAPIAGVFFALEVVIGSYALRNFAPVVVASVTGTIISRSYFGDYAAFIIPEHAITSFLEFPAFALLGGLSAVVAIALVWSIDFVRQIHDRFEIPKFFRPIIAGLMIGGIGLVFPQVMGVGYEATDEALNEQLTLLMLVTLIVMKTAATAITLGSNFGGGIFSPSLFLGAMLGGAFGIVATSILPELSSGHGAYTLVGMGAVAGAALGAPISTIFIVYELTQDSALTIAVMIATVLSSQIFTGTYKRSFFFMQLETRGVDITASRESQILRDTKVAEVMEQDYVTVQPSALLPEIRKKLIKTRYSEIFVTDEQGLLVGTIMLSDLGEDAFEHDHDAETRAIDVCRRTPPVALMEQGLEEAMTLLETSHEEHIAVVESMTHMRLLGVLHEHDVMARYHQCIIDTRQEDRA